MAPTADGEISKNLSKSIFIQESVVVGRLLHHLQHGDATSSGDLIGWTGLDEKALQRTQHKGNEGGDI